MAEADLHKYDGNSLERELPDVYQQLVQARNAIEDHFRDVCDIEFTVEKGRLFILNVRPAKRSGRASLRFALQFFSEGKIGIAEVLNRVRPRDIEEFIEPEIRNKSSLTLVGQGLPASSGAAAGKVVFNATDAIKLVRQGYSVLLARDEVNPEDMEAIRASQGVLTSRGGMTSHASLVCRALGKPAVCGFSQLRIGHDMLTVDGDEGWVLEKGGWITIDGVSGKVYLGKGDCIGTRWQDQPELVAFASIVDLALASRDVPREVVGRTWSMRDFFAHAIPLRRHKTTKKPVPRQTYVSFAQPDDQTLRLIRSNLMSICAEDQEDYRRILFSLSDALSRQLASNIGVGQHHLYFRPLWDPEACCFTQSGSEGSQLIGFEYFGINRYLPHLVDISTITFLMEIESNGESDKWFLDRTNPNGESLVVSSDQTHAYHLLINDAVSSYYDLPLLYDSLRRREYFWRFYETNHTSYEEIVDFLSAWPNRRRANSSLAPLCFELGLIRGSKRTTAGESLLGKHRRKHKYEFVRSEQGACGLNPPS
jgi:phosphohistidine swiveling domain-containing protein